MEKIIFKTDNKVINNWLPKFAVCKNGDTLASVQKSIERVFPRKIILIGGNKSRAIDRNDKTIYEEFSLNICRKVRNGYFGSRALGVEWECKLRIYS
jgi:hypothetical protein